MSFVDFNFKLAVLEAIIQKDEGLRRSLDRLVDRHYDEDDDRTYEPIPGVKSHIEAMTFTPAQLASVEEIVLDGGNETCHMLIPYWDGEDSNFDVSTVEGFELLPNLRRVVPIALYEDREHPSWARMAAAGVDVDW